MPESHDLPGPRRLPAGHDQPLATHRGVEWAPLQPVGQPRGSHGVGSILRSGNQGQAQRLEPGLRPGGDRRVSSPGPLATLVPQQPDPKLEAEEDAHGRRPGGLAFLRPAARLGEIPVGARHASSFRRRPRARADDRNRDSRRPHPRLLAGAHHQVDPPGVHLELDRPQPADPVDHHQRIAGRGVHRRCQLTKRVRDAGGGLVVGQQHRAVGLRARQVLRQGSGIRGRSPVGLEAGDICSKRARDLGEAVTEGADRHHQHPVSRRQGVDDGRLHGTTPRTGQEEHIGLLSSNQGPDPRGDLVRA